MRSESAKLLWDARWACRLVREFTDGRTLEDFEESALLRSAVERQLEIVGFRNVLAHGYDAVSDRVSWDIVQSHVPALLSLLEGLLGP